MMITIFIVLTVGAVFAQTMPNSTIKDGAVTLVRPYLALTGLEQNWSIFAPNPRAQSSYILARVERADGSVAVRQIPTGVGLSAYWEYRWRKFAESMAEPGGGRGLWRSYAEWVVSEDQRAGGDPVRVTLMRRSSRTLPPGPQADALPFVDEDFYTAPVSAR
jgi:hypothetical protein